DANVPYNQVIKTGLHEAYPATDSIVWQPRIGFAWSPLSSDKTVFRGGIGIFTDTFPRPWSITSRRTLRSRIRSRSETLRSRRPRPTTCSRSLLARTVHS